MSQDTQDSKVQKMHITQPDPYLPSARFRCKQGHGIWRRDQLPTRRGSLVCAVGIRGGYLCGLKLEASP